MRGSVITHELRTTVKLGGLGEIGNQHADRRRSVRWPTDLVGLCDSHCIRSTPRKERKEVKP